MNAVYVTSGADLKQFDGRLLIDDTASLDHLWPKFAVLYNHLGSFLLLFSRSVGPVSVWPMSNPLSIRSLNQS